MRPTVSSSLVGRHEELVQLEESLRSAAAGAGSTIVVGGEAGIGKSRLVGELAARAGGYGATVLAGHCLDLAGSVPFLPFADAFGPIDGSPFAESLLEADPRGLPNARFRLFRESLDLLGRLGSAAPVVLVLEDVHRADAATLDLAIYLAHAAHELPLVLALTCRGESRLGRFESEVVRAGATMLRLAPLGGDDLELLVAELAGGDSTPELVEQICARSDGNPLFAEQLVAASLRGERQVPRALRELLLGRIAALDAAALATLRVASAVGRDVPYRLLAAVSPLPEPELLEALRQAVEHDVLLADQAAGVFRFERALLAEAVYATILPGEREALHERIADALVAEGARATEVAHHWAGAGHKAQALVSSLDAAREAERISGFAEALRHLERALELWPAREATADSNGLDRPAVLEWAAELASLAGAVVRAVELAREALRLLGDGERVRAAAIEASLGIYLASAGDFEGALRTKERALELVPAEPASRERALALSGLGRMLTLSWRHAESARCCEEAIGVARATGALRAELEATATLGVDLCYLGRADDGIARLEAARRLWEEHGCGVRELPTIDVFGDLSDVLLMLGRFGDAARVALEGLATTMRLGLERSLASALGANAAEALIALGKWGQARELLDRALRLRRGYRFVILLAVAELELGCGEFAVARSHLDEAAAGAQKSREAGRLAALVAELELWEGRLDAARAIVDRALGETTAEAPVAVVRLAALGLAIEAESALLARAIGDAAGTEQAAARARRLVATAREADRSAAAITPLASGWRTLADAEYERCRGKSIPARWAAAAAAWDELEHPYRAAYCRWRESEALVARRAARGVASAPARRAYEACVRLGAEPMRRELELLAERARLDVVGLEPERARSEYGGSLGLTARECEVIQLLGRGYTNREIADELTISAKTASVHVTHILRKLNAASRIEAASIAHRLMPPPTP